MSKLFKIVAKKLKPNLVGTKKIISIKKIDDLITRKAKSVGTGYAVIDLPDGESISCRQDRMRDQVISHFRTTNQLAT